MALTLRKTVDCTAARLVQNNQVTWAHGVPVVADDYSTYMVRHEANRSTCTCRWATERPEEKACSHVLAATLTAPAAAAVTSQQTTLTQPGPVKTLRYLAVQTVPSQVQRADRCPECNTITTARITCLPCGWVAPGLNTSAPATSAQKVRS